MKKQVLLTGGTGFIGHNILPFLQEDFDVLSPKRNELDLFNQRRVRKYLVEKSIDIVVHCANPNPVKNPIDKNYSMLGASLSMFMNLYAARDCYEKMIYLGSGAEYDKSMDVVNVNESECFRSIPSDEYGFAKYIMNSLADKSSNIYNVCLFGCYGKGDYHTKFITHCINCCKENRSITIRQECKFDYIHVMDLGKMIKWMCQNDLEFHMYNASGGPAIWLSEIAEEVKKQMKADVAIEILNPGNSNEYTSNGNRFWKESGLYPKISIQDGIKMQIKYEKEETNTTKTVYRKK